MDLTATKDEMKEVRDDVKKLLQGGCSVTDQVSGDEEGEFPLYRGCFVVALVRLVAGSLVAVLWWTVVLVRTVV